MENRGWKTRVQHPTIELIIPYHCPSWWIDYSLASLQSQIWFLSSFCRLGVGHGHTVQKKDASTGSLLFLGNKGTVLFILDQVTSPTVVSEATEHILLLNHVVIQ